VVVNTPDVSCEELPNFLVSTVDGVCGVVGLTDEHAAPEGGERGLGGGVLVGDPEFTVLPDFQG
jgi:hypothetical protein